MEGCQSERIDWTCEHCDAQRYQCVDCGEMCIEDGGEHELCELCFRGREQATKLEQLTRGDYVLMPASVEHARAMLAVAEAFLGISGKIRN